MQGFEKGHAKRGGRVKGVPNKTTVALKEAILAALEAAHAKGAVGYLTQQAKENPGAFMTLVGKVLPMQVGGIDGNAIGVDINIRMVKGALEDQS